MKPLHVGIGELQVSSNRDEVIRTFALGSCVGVVVYDQVRAVAGLLHVALPESSVNLAKAETLPGYFADTGIPRLLLELKQAGASRENVWIKIVGGSSIMDDVHRFDIGRRNVLAIKKLLWKSQLGIIAEEVGGTISRTVSVNVADGKVTVSSQGKQWEL